MTRPHTPIQREASADVLATLNLILFDMTSGFLDPDDAVERVRDMVKIYDSRIAGDRRMRKLD